MVNLLKKNKKETKPMELDFILSHNLFSRAEVDPTDKVFYQLFS